MGSLVHLGRQLLATSVLLGGVSIAQLTAAGPAAAATPDDCGLLGNLVANCGFETGDLTSWTGSGATVDGSDVHSGSDAGNLSGAGSSTLTQTISGTDAGKQYDLMVWITTTSERDAFTAEVDNVVGTTQAFSISAQPFDDSIPYEVIDVPFTATATAPAIKFTDANSGSGGAYHVDDVSVTLSSCSDVPGNLVQNCGFETGDTTDWTPTLSGSDAGVVSTAHSGSDAFRFGDTDFDTLTQTLAGTHDGDQYELAFWLRGSASGSAEFSASILNAQGGASVLQADVGPPGPGDYHLFTATFTAGSSAPTLEFAGRNAASFFFLDDISVRQLTAKVTFDTQGGSTAPAQQVATVGDPTTAPADPTRSGYTFRGWDTEPGGIGQAWDFSTDPVETDLTLYALWSADQPSCVSPANLVLNCSFESGATDWTAGADADTGVDLDPVDLPHSGDHFFSFGATGLSDISLSQVISGTTAGLPYQLQFWLLNTDAGPDFSATVEGTADASTPTLSLANPDPFAYTRYTLNFIAGASSPTVVFAGRHPIGWIDLDDVSVVRAPSSEPAPPPVSIALASSPNPSVFGQPVSFTATVSPIPSCGVLRWLVDGVEQGADRGAASGTPAPGGESLTLGPLPGLSVGAHEVQLLAPACESSSGGSAGTVQVVGKAATSLTVSVSGGTASAVVTPTAPGAGTPTGAVTFSLDGQAFATVPVGAGGTASASLPGEAAHVSAAASRSVSAAYGGDGSFTGSSATSSVAVTNPTITAQVTSASAKTSAGWYRSAVHIAFTCAEGSAPLATPCPDPVTLSDAGAGQSVSATVTATDGGTATTVVSPVNIDLGAPRLHVKHKGHKLTCIASDGLSGVASCTIHRHRHTKRGVTTVHWTATATDNAGNRTTRHGHYS